MQTLNIDKTYYCEVCHIHNRVKKCALCGTTTLLYEVDWEECEKCKAKTPKLLNSEAMTFCMVCGFKLI